MAYDPATGAWQPEDESVQSRMTGMLATDSPYMQQATTQGLQYANKRGLLNSSMAAGAVENSRIGAALPIASQEASQAHAANLGAANRDSSERIAGMNVQAHDRQYLAGSMAELQKKYGAMYDDIQKNTALTAEQRTQQLEHIMQLRNDDMSLLEQIYGVDLTWSTPGLGGGGTTGGTPGGTTGGTGGTTGGTGGTTGGTGGGGTQPATQPLYGDGSNYYRQTTRYGGYGYGGPGNQRDPRSPGRSAGAGGGLGGI